MKRIVLILLAALTLYSCGQQGIPNNKSVVKGKLTVPSTEMIYLCVDDPHDFGFDVIPIDSAKMDEKGNFSFNFICPTAMTTLVRLGEEIIVWNMFVYPQSELQVTIDNSNPIAIKTNYQGKAASANNLFKDLETMFSRDNSFYNEFYNDDVTPWLNFVDTRYNQGIALLNEFYAKDSVPLPIKDQLDSKVRYAMASAKNDFVLENYYYNPDRRKGLVIDSNYYKFLDKLNLQGTYSDAYTGKYLMTLAEQWRFSKLDEGKNPTGVDISLAKYDLARLRFWGKSRDIAMTWALREMLLNYNQPEYQDYVKKLLPDYQALLKDKDFAGSIISLLKRRLALRKDEPAPNFKLPNYNNQTVKLEDLRGKPVYIAFWGAWLQPSIDGLDKYHDLIAKFKEGTINFVSVGLEYRNFDNWLKVLNAKQLNAINLYSERQFENPMPRAYVITAIPTYVIIDKDGKMFDADAPGPEDPKTVEILKKLL